MTLSKGRPKFQIILNFVESPKNPNISRRFLIPKGEQLKHARQTFEMAIFFPFFEKKIPREVCLALHCHCLPLPGYALTLLAVALPLYCTARAITAKNGNTRPRFSTPPFCGTCSKEAVKPAYNLSNSNLKV
jgi:hypothetical protein